MTNPAPSFLLNPIITPAVSSSSSPSPPATILLQPPPLPPFPSSLDHHSANYGLLLLSTVATAQPTAKRSRAASRKPNPRCSKPGHSSQNKASIQRHTCFRCFSERATALAANPHLTRWDVACLLEREFRNYYCCCCVLEACVDKDFTRVCLNKLCRNGHEFICRQHYCTAHNKRLTVCRECPDPRAGSSFHECGVRVCRKCNCGHAPLGDAPQDPAVVERKEAYAVSMLDRARTMRLEAEQRELANAQQQISFMLSPSNDASSGSMA